MQTSKSASFLLPCFKWAGMASLAFGAVLFFMLRPSVAAAQTCFGIPMPTTITCVDKGVYQNCPAPTTGSMWCGIGQQSCCQPYGCACQLTGWSCGNTCYDQAGGSTSCNSSTCATPTGGGGSSGYCGDGSCNNGETCSSCASDCGSCATPACGTNMQLGSGSPPVYQGGQATFTIKIYDPGVNRQYHFSMPCPANTTCGFYGIQGNTATLNGGNWNCSYWSTCWDSHPLYIQTNSNTAVGTVSATINVTTSWYNPPPDDTWYNDNCVDHFNVSFNVLAPPPAINSFTVTTWGSTNSTGPVMTVAQNSMTFNWSTSNATGCTINGVNVATNGSMNATAPSSGLGSATYTLVCNGPGGSANKAISISVPPAPTLSSFTCPSPGTQANGAWTLPGGYTTSYIRVHSGLNNNTWPPDVYQNDTGGTSVSFSTTANSSYTLWVHTKASNGAWSDPFTTSTTCTPPPPSCSSMGPTTGINAVAGTSQLDFYAYGVQNAQSVYFPTWSEVNGQDDLIWYPATNQGGGTWKATVNLANHRVGNPDSGIFDTHVWMYSGASQTGTSAFCGGASYTVNVPVAGSCGPAAATYSSSASGYAGAYCNSGSPTATPAFPAAGSSTSWACNGAYGGANSPTCTATRAATPINGACGSSSGKTYPYGTANYGSDSQCNPGTSTNTAFPAAGNTVTWVCNGANGGTNSGTCGASQAPQPINGSCGPAAIIYAATASTYSGALCTSGTPNPASPAFPAQGESLTWVCQGSNGGSNSGTCTASRSWSVCSTLTYKPATSGLSLSNTGPTGSSLSIAQGQTFYAFTDYGQVTDSIQAPNIGGGYACVYETFLGTVARFRCAAPSSVTGTFTYTTGTNYFAPPGSNICASGPTTIGSITVNAPVSGSCGPAAKGYAATDTAFAGALCGSGTPSPNSPTFPAQGGSSTWVCQGTYNGSDSGSCTATRAVPTCDAAPGANYMKGCVYSDITFGSYAGPATAGPTVSSPADNVTVLPYADITSSGMAGVTSNYSIRWSGTFTFSGGWYIFNTGSDDGKRIYVDGALTYDDWNYQGYSLKSSNPINISAGSHTITYEFFQGGGGAAYSMAWTKQSPVGGACGSASGKLYPNGTAGYGSDQQCASGSSTNTSFPAAGTTVTWVCNGIYGGSNSGNCSATQAPACTALSYKAATSGFSTSASGPSGSSLNVVAGQTFYAFTDYAAAGTDSIQAPSVSGSFICVFDAFLGSVARFSCMAPAAAGSYTYTTGTNYYAYPGSNVCASGPTVMGTVTSQIPNPPTTPATAENTAMNGSVICATAKLSWAAPSSGPAPQGYRIYRNGSFLASVSGAGTVRYTDSSASLVPGTNYTYEVSSYIGTAESSRLSVGTVAPTPCNANLSDSDKDIAGVNTYNFTSPARGSCNGFQAVPSDANFKAGDIVHFTINICNDTGQGDATNVILTDRLTNLQQPPAGWNAKLGDANSNMPQPITPSVSGISPYLDSTLTFGVGTVSVSKIRTLTFDAQIAVPATYASTYARFQNTATIDFTKNAQGQNGSTVSVFTPFLIFSTAEDYPGRGEIAP